MTRQRNLLIGATVSALAIGTTLTGIYLLQPHAEINETRVVKVLDGDTIEVRNGFWNTQVINLLGIAAPSNYVHIPNGMVGQPTPQPAQCLQEEATAQLQTLLPPGTSITLKYDPSTRTPTKHTAAVYKDGQLINAELAGAGLAVPIDVQSADELPLYEEIQTAAINAIRQHKGLYNPTIECTPVAQRDRILGDIFDRFPKPSGDANADETALTAWEAEFQQLLADNATQRENDPTNQVMHYRDINLPFTVYDYDGGTISAEYKAKQLRDAFRTQSQEMRK